MDIFLSHSSSDSKLAERLSKGLERHGLSVWLDSKDLKPGSNWRREVEDAIHSAGSVALLLGRDQVSDQAQQFTWQRALEAVWEDPRKRLIPILYRGARLPKFVLSGASGGEIQVVRIEDARKLRRVVETIAELANGGTRTGGRRLRGDRSIDLDQERSEPSADTCCEDTKPKGPPKPASYSVDSSDDSSKSGRLTEIEEFALKLK